MFYVSQIRILEKFFVDNNKKNILQKKYNVQLQLHIDDEVGECWDKIIGFYNLKKNVFVLYNKL